jgi:hypothetical protein
MIKRDWDVGGVPIPWLNQRLLRGVILTTIVMYFITNLMKRIIETLLSARFGSPGTLSRAFPFEALVLHLERA